MKHIKAHWPLLLIIPLFLFLFFYRFDWATLANWDEAWYGAIARNIANTGNFLKMEFNGKTYYDHPPLGFILMAASIKLFGATTFAVRFPSAILGLGSVVLIYFLGRELFKEKMVGLAASMVLGTSVWYLVRVRSGDLDSVFVFFYILTAYLSVRSVKNFALFPLTMASFAFLILSKTLVGASAAVLILFNNLLPVFKSKKNFLLGILGLVVFAAIVTPWYYVQLRDFEHFYEEHFVRIGMRSKGLASYFHLELFLPLFYLHMGVRKWYYIWLAAVGFLLLTFRFIKKPYFFILLWNLVILYPFLTTNETHIWHLIPVYVPMSLVIASSLFFGKELLIKITRLKKLNLLVNLAYLGFFIVLSAVQIKNFYPEIFPTSRYVPDDVDVAQKASKFPQKIYLDDDFTPVAIYYSGRNMTNLITLPDEYKKALGFFQSEEKDFVMITRNYVLNILKENNVDYKVDYQNGSYSIISRPTSQP